MCWTLCASALCVNVAGISLPLDCRSCPPLEAGTSLAPMSPQWRVWLHGVSITAAGGTRPGRRGSAVPPAPAHSRAGALRTCLCACACAGRSVRATCPRLPHSETCVTLGPGLSPLTGSSMLSSPRPPASPPPAHQRVCTLCKRESLAGSMKPTEKSA